jgi:sec-independent protein translocase protein TatC
VGGNPFRRRSARQRNADGTMTLMEHLYELRYRLGLALLAVLVGGIIGFLWFSHGVGPVPSLGVLLTEPYCSLPLNLKATLAPGQPCKLLTTQPFEAFSLQMKVGVTAGIVLTCPVWLHQLWAFITPGLYARERKFARVFVGFAAVLFVGGAALAYIIVARALQMLLGFGGGQTISALTGTAYFNFMVSLLVVFGASFEIPLLVVMLNRVGVVRYEQLKKWRRGIIFGLFVFAAVATPSADALTMTVLAVTLTLLFEIAIQITRLHDRKLARQRAAEGWDSWSDEEQSPLNHRVEPVDDVEPVEPSSLPTSLPSSGHRYDDAT